MRRNGWDAYGVDIDADFIHNGRRSFSALGVDPSVLVHASELETHGRRPFDVIVSYMVLEHVRDLESTARAMRRVMQVGGCGLHLYPGRWRLREAHTGVPVAHWFRGARSRRVLERCVKRGWDHRSHWGMDVATDEEIVDRFMTYLEENTRYRSNPDIVGTFEAAGFAAKISMTDHRLARPHGPVPEPLLRASLARLLTAHLLLEG